MATAVLDYYLYNGEAFRTETFDHIYTESSPAVYEVIRLEGGRPVFPREHYDRLVGSLETVGEGKSLSYETYCGDIRLLSQMNGCPDHNCRLVLNGFGSAGGVRRYLFMIPTSYPSEEQYRDGVTAGFLKAVRSDPHAKIWNASLREKADRRIREEGLFETILLDDSDRITEGSRSNIFFIRDGRVYTTPAEAVLLGVTRKTIIEACESAGIPVIEQYFGVRDAARCEAAFISGTSPKALPVRRLGTIALDPGNALLRKIMALYDAASARSTGE